MLKMFAIIDQKDGNYRNQRVDSSLKIKYNKKDYRYYMANIAIYHLI